MIKENNMNNEKKTGFDDELLEHGITPDIEDKIWDAIELMEENGASKVIIMPDGTVVFE